MLRTAVRVVESPSPLVVIVSLFSARQKRQDRAYAYPLIVTSQSSKSLPSASGYGFPTLMSSGRGCDTDCPIGSHNFSESRHCCVHRSA